MEFRLYKGMFDENMPLFGTGLRTSMQSPNKLKYWFDGYAFYKCEDGQFYAEEMEKEYKDNFYWNICGIEQDFCQTLDELNKTYRNAIEKLEKLTDLAAPYGVVPVSFEPALSRRNQIIIRNLVFITSQAEKYFEVKTTLDFYNITTKTANQLVDFTENTLANPHRIIVDENGNVEETQ